MSAASVGRVHGSVSRVVSIAPEDKLSRASIFATVALEHRLTEADGDRLLDAGLSAAQVDALRTTLQQGQSAVGQHTTEAHQTKKGKSGLYAEFYEEINLNDLTDSAHDIQKVKHGNQWIVKFIQNDQY